MSQYTKEQMIYNLHAKMRKGECVEHTKNEVKTTSVSEPKLAYDEYLEYCKQNAVMPNIDNGKTLIEKNPYTETIRPIHVGQAINAYSKAENAQIASIYESNA